MMPSHQTLIRQHHKHIHAQSHDVGGDECGGWVIAMP
jgi:hypothetical protein